MARSDESRSWIIRSGTADDAAGVREVARAAWPATYAGLLPDDVIAAFLARGYSLERLQRRIVGADRFDVAVGDAGEVVAFAEWLFPARGLGPQPSAGAATEEPDTPPGPGTAIRAGNSNDAPAAPLPDAELAAVYVRPDWQRRGIGGAFHERGLAAYRGRAASIVLAVARDNGPALAFYRRAGYVVDAEYVEELLGTGLAELRMRLRL